MWGFGRLHFKNPYCCKCCIYCNLSRYFRWFTQIYSMDRRFCSTCCCRYFSHCYFSKRLPKIKTIYKTKFCNWLKKKSLSHEKWIAYWNPSRFRISWRCCSNKWRYVNSCWWDFITSKLNYNRLKRYDWLNRSNS